MLNSGFRCATESVDRSRVDRCHVVQSRDEAAESDGSRTDEYSSPTATYHDCRWRRPWDGRFRPNKRRPEPVPSRAERTGSISPAPRQSRPLQRGRGDMERVGSGMPTRRTGFDGERGDHRVRAETPWDGREWKSILNKFIVYNTIQRNYHNCTKTKGILYESHAVELLQYQYVLFRKSCAYTSLSLCIYK